MLQRMDFQGGGEACQLTGRAGPLVALPQWGLEKLHDVLFLDSVDPPSAVVSINNETSSENSIASHMKWLNKRSPSDIPEVTLA